MNADEQQELFQKLGLDTGDANQAYLSRIGAFYNGHPLVLRVIAEEILQPPFQGDVACYWRRYEAEFVDSPPPKTHKLARSRQFRRRVRQRVEQSLQRLPAPARQMLCASAVFRRPVSEAFWQAMLADGDAQAPFDTLRDRHLVEYVPATDDQAPLRVRQHNLIRAVAYDLLKADRETWFQAERQAAQLWLTDYEPAPNAPNLETLRGYLEAFEHYYAVKDWQAAKDLPDTELETGQPLHWQLYYWSYYRELMVLQSKALTIAREINNPKGEGAALKSLGNAYTALGQYEQAIDHYQQSLSIAREIGNRQGKVNALNNLGIVYNNLGQYEQAIDHYQQSLTIAREISDRRGEGNALGNMGATFLKIGQYPASLTHIRAALEIFREIGDRGNEAEALKNLAALHQALGEIETARRYCQQALALATTLGVPLAAECEALGRELGGGEAGEFAQHEGLA